MELKGEALKLYDELSSLTEEIQVCNLQIKILAEILKNKSERVEQIMKKLNEE